eukprot:6214518-Pleurochrysis_carterae.AAC.3
MANLSNGSGQGHVVGRVRPPLLTMPGVEGCPGMLCPYNIPLGALAYEWTGYAVPPPLPKRNYLVVGVG